MPGPVVLVARRPGRAAGKLQDSAKSAQASSGQGLLPPGTARQATRAVTAAAAREVATWGVQLAHARLLVSAPAAGPV